MPRRHRSARDRRPAPPSRPPGSVAPAWAQKPGYAVRQVTSQRSYVCPGCGTSIIAGTQHIVAFPEHDPDARRHWHTHCWRIERRAPRQT